MTTIHADYAIGEQVYVIMDNRITCKKVETISARLDHQFCNVEYWIQNNYGLEPFPESEVFPSVAKALEFIENNVQQCG